MQRSASDRVRMTCEMFDLARALMVSNIRATYPGISERELRVKIFERTYADDFGAEARARIIACLRRSATTPWPELPPRGTGESPSL
jgi:hypothetical protein